jgi:MFS family permease
MTIDPGVYARRWKTLGVLSLSLVIIGLDTTTLNVALPTLQSEFDASNSKLQWMVDSYLLVFAGLLLVFGTLGDRYGPKLALQAGVTIFGLASLGALVVDSADGVIAVRAAMGVGAALIMPATLGVFLVFFSAYDAVAGIATGLAMRSARDLSAVQQEGVFDVVKDWPAVGPPFALSMVGTLGWLAAVGALALAARRQGAPRLEWIFVGLAAVLLTGGHPFPAGTLAFGCFSAAALLHEFRGSS